MYVRLKHALSALALEAVRTPARRGPRGAAAVLEAFCDLCGGSRFALPVAEVAARAGKAARSGERARSGSAAWRRLATLGVLERDDGVLSLPVAFRPHFAYLNRQARRLGEALRALDRRPMRGRRVPGRITAVRRGAALFNAGLFFECHEYFETLWRAAPARDRDLYQGIILVAAGFYHHEKGNRHGARIKLQAGFRKLEPHRPAAHGLDLDGWLAALAGWLARLEAGERPGVLDSSEIPQIPVTRR